MKLRQTPKLPGDASVAADQAGPVQLARPGISSLPFQTPKLPSFCHLFGLPNPDDKFTGYPGTEIGGQSYPQK